MAVAGWFGSFPAKAKDLSRPKEDIVYHTKPIEAPMTKDQRAQMLLMFGSEMDRQGLSKLMCQGCINSGPKYKLGVRTMFQTLQNDSEVATAAITLEPSRQPPSSREEKDCPWRKRSK